MSKYIHPELPRQFERTADALAVSSIDWKSKVPQLLVSPDAELTASERRFFTAAIKLAEVEAELRRLYCKMAALGQAVLDEGEQSANANGV